jgi:stress response protein YsnF
MRDTYTGSRTVVAVFRDRNSAQRAVDDLVSNGFSRSDVHLTTNDDFASDAAYGNTMLRGEHHEHMHHGGGIGGFFRRLFGSDQVDEREERRYSDAVRRGHVVLTVHGDEERIRRAEDIFERYNPVDIDDEGTGERVADVAEGREQVVPVVEEQLRVGKREERSPVRIYTRTVETPVEQDVELREERVRVDRRPADRPAEAGDFQHGDQVIEVTETIEQAVVDKERRVVEEVVVGKEATTRRETIRDTVRHTEVDVDPTDRDTKTRR